MKIHLVQNTMGMAILAFVDEKKAKAFRDDRDKKWSVDEIEVDESVHPDNLVGPPDHAHIHLALTFTVPVLVNGLPTLGAYTQNLLMSIGSLGKIEESEVTMTVLYDANGHQISEIPGNIGTRS